jgi:signal transduction histidine kinase
MKKILPKNKTEKIVHDINNLLTSTNLSAELLEKEFYGPLNAKQKEHLKGILSDGKKIKDLIKKLTKN